MRLLGIGQRMRPANVESISSRGGGDQLQSRFEEFLRKAHEQLEGNGEVSLLTCLQMLGHIALLEQNLGLWKSEKVHDK